MSDSAVQSVHPLTPLQEGLLFHTLYDEAVEDVYVVRLTVELAGPVEPERLRAAAQVLLDRHPNLRAAFRQRRNGRTVQIVPRRATVDLAVTDLSGDADPEVGWSGLEEADRERRFDLAAPPLLRFTLARLGPERFRLLLTHHHILLDGWSVPIVLRELLALYRGEDLPALPAYAGYLDWLSRQDRTAAENAWRERLAGIDQPTLLFRDTGAPTAAGANTVLELSETQTAAVVERARALGVTVNPLVQAAWAIVLGRLTGRDDVVYGTTVAGRPPEVPGVEAMVGLFINTLPMRVRLRPDRPLADIVRAIQDGYLGLLDHQHVGLADVRRAAGAAGSFDTLVVFENYPYERVTEPGDVRITGVRGQDANHYPVTLVAVPGPRLRLRLAYRPDLIDADQARACLDRVSRVLHEIVASPGQPVGRLGILLPGERGRAVAHGTPGSQPTTIPELFDACRARTPDAVAVVADESELTYAELDARAGRLAAVLAARGARPERVVAVAMPRSVELIVALLAIAKTGAAYLPLDPDYPARRLALMVEDARPLLAVVNPAAPAGDLPADLPRVPTDAVGEGAELTAPHPEHPAYIMYTSGSTGRPKGVVVRQRDVAALALDASFAGDAHRRVLFHSPHTFDASLLELWVPLANGATIVVAPPERLGPAAIERLVTRHRITAAGIVAGLFSVLAEESPGCLAGLREVWAGGDVVPPHAARAVLAACPGLSLVDSYGPTEATLFALRHRIPRIDEVSDPIPIGTPLDGMRACVLDSCLQPVPDGVLGELYVAGDGVARGYLGRPDLTAERFVADPCGPPGARMYRTGDLVRRRSDGAFEFAGRADAQVKIRGFRVEPDEVASVLAAHPDVASAVVVAREDQPGDKRLVGYAVPRNGSVDPAALREYLAARLPAHLVPAAVVPLDALPLTANGKVDRKALPAPEAGPAGVGAPRTPQQEILCGLFAEVLGRAETGVHDDFFALGGHSLLATRLTSRIRSVIGVELPVRAVFEAPTVAELAKRLASGERRPALVRAERPDPLPVSFGQQRLWFLSRLDETSATYHISLALRLSGPLHVEALRAAVRDVTARHEILRTTYPEHDGTPYQVVHEAPEIDLRVAEATEPELPDLLADTARAEFDLARDLPLRVTVYRLAPDLHVLLLVAHHIAADGWSMAPLLADLGTAYAARRRERAPGWSPLPVQYADYALWQRGPLADGLARQLDFWRAALDGLPEELPLPTDRPRPAILSSGAASVPIRIGPRLHRAITEAAVQHRATVFMVVQAALAVLLSRLGAGLDIPIGATIAGRTDDALDRLVGFFVNTLVLRTDVSGDPTFAELLKRVREFDLNAYAHQDVPFEQLVEMLEAERSLGRHPLFQVMLAFQNAVRAEPALDGLSVRTEPVRTSAAKFDLLVELAERHGENGRPEGIVGQIEYRTDLFDPDSAARLAERFVLVLEQLTAEPRRRISAIDVLLPAERRRLAPEADAPRAATIAEEFAAQAARTPEAVAVLAGAGELTYRELDERATRLARALAEHGAGPERIVAVALPRSLELVIALLAVAKAGAAYLPLDPGYPAARLAQMVADARPVVLIGEPGDPGEYASGIVTVHADASGTADLISAGADAAAYVMYTSGSTGRPKGVVVRQTDVTALVADPSCRQAASRILLHSPHTFDAATFELWVPLLSGGTVVVAPPGDLDAARIGELVEKHDLTALWLTAGLFAAVAEESPGCLAGLHEVWAGGDVVPAEAVRTALTACPGLTVVNGYGPTETTTFALRHRTTEPVVGRVPIGTPLIGMRVYVLDDALREVPPGVPGELYIAGAGLARGYLNQPGRTAERFLADLSGPPGARMYRTGDRVRRRPDDVIEFLGRADDQVKIRGFRIEPGEIEHVLTEHPAVDRAVVLARADRLTAYAISAVDETELRRHLADRLPSHLVPSAIVVLDRFPLTRIGKIDRAALPDPAAVAATGRAPETPEEKLLCELFADVLGVPRVGADDGFFALGGDSISSVRLVGRARAAGFDLSVRDVFRDSTPAALARPRAVGRERFAFDPVLSLRAGIGEPLFCVAPASGIAWIYARLAEPLECPIYGLQAPGLHSGEVPAADVAQLVALHLPRIREIQPNGPYRLMGHSFGGLVAHALAVALRAEGEPVSLLALLDCYPAQPDAAPDREPELGPLDLSAFELDDAELAAVHRVRLASARLAARFVPGVFNGDALFFSAADDPRIAPGSWRSWEPYVLGRIENHDIAADHHRMMRAPAPLAAMAHVLKEKTRKGTDR